MKFHKLQVENLNSLYGQQIIDFEKHLSQVPLYLIVGPTGAGKSSILDAICLALFGATPRLTKDSKKKPSPEALSTMMSYGTSETCVILEFSKVTQQGRKRYKAQWQQHRARKKAEGNPRIPKRSLECWDEKKKEWEPLVISDKAKEYLPYFEEVLESLELEEFLRCVILAQGDFARLLKAPESEKAKLLEKLTGTNIYRELGQLAKENFRTIDKKYQSFHSEVESVQTFSEDYEENLEQQIQKHRNELEESRKTVQEMKEQLSWLEKLQTAQQKQQSTQELLKEHLKQQETIQEKQERTKQFEQVLPIRDAFNEFQISSNEQKQLQRTLQLLEGSLLSAQQELTKAEKEREETEQLFQQQKLHFKEEVTPLLRKIAEKRGEQKQLQQEFEQLQQELKQLETRIAKGTSYIQEQEKQLQERKAKLQEEQQQWLTKDSSYRFLESLPMLEKSFQEHKENEKKYQQLEEKSLHLKHQFEDQQKKHQTHKKEENELKKQVEDLTNKQTVLLEDSDLSISSEQLQIEAKQYQQTLFQLETFQLHWTSWSQENLHLQQKRKELEQQKKQQGEIETSLGKVCEELGQIEERNKISVRELSYQQTVVALVEERKKLQVGASCPLCFSTEHPFRNADDIAAFEHEAQSKYEQQQQVVSQEQEHIQQLRAKKIKLETTLETNTSQVDEKTKELEALEAKQQKKQQELQEQFLLIFPTDRHLHQLTSQDIKDQLQKTQQTLSQQQEIQQKVEKRKQQLQNLREELIQKNIQLQQLQQLQQEQELTFHRQKQEQTQVTQELQELSQKNQQKITEFQDLLSSNLPGLNNEQLDWKHTDTIYQQLVSLQKELKDFHQKLLQTQEQYTQDDSKFTKHKLVFEQLQEQKQEIEKKYTQVKKHQQEVENALLELCQGKQTTDIEKQWEEKLTTLEQRWKSALQTWEICSKKQTTTKAKQQTLQQEHLSFTKRATQSKKEIEDFLSTTAFAEMKEIESLLQSEQELLLEQKQVEAWKSKFEHIQQQQKQQIETLEQLLNKPLCKPNDSLEEKHQAVQERETSLAALQQQLGVLQEKFEQKKKLQNKQKNFEKEIAETQREWELWKEIDGLIGVGEGKNFSAFAQALNLQRIAKGANHHLQKMAPRYTLDVLYENNFPKLDFVIKDAHQANQARKISTLSGGETFLVSLALALSLSEHYGKKIHMETLLLDEGFGSLDPETLELAIQTLHTLSSDSSQQIGIISHVEALRERILHKVTVAKLGNGRSKIEVSHF